MTCGDLFAGIGGMSLGLERAGERFSRWTMRDDEATWLETVALLAMWVAALLALAWLVRVLRA